MSREAFEAALNKEIKGVGIDFSMEGDRYFVSEVHSAWHAWQAALVWAYADAARMCDEMFNRYANADECAEAIRERAKEVTR